MNSNSDAIIAVILDKVKKEYKDDVSLVCCYGSYVNGTSTTMSDVDFYFVPRTDRANELITTFIIGGIGYDFWAIPWERLERFSNFDEPLVSLVADCRIVYCGREEDRRRFLELQNKIEAIKKQPINRKMLDKAEECIKSAMTEYCKISISENKAEIRQGSGRLLLDISDSVVLMNNSYFKYGIKKQLAEILRVQHVPMEFENLYNRIIRSQSPKMVRESCLKMISSTYALHQKLRDGIQVKENPKDVLSGLYEEICSTWNKIYKACDNEDANLAFLAGTCLQRELDSISRTCGIPELSFMGQFSFSNLQFFKAAARKVEELFIDQLRKAGLPIKTYDSVEAFRQDY